MFKDENELKNKINKLNINTKANQVHREKLKEQILSAFNETQQKQTARAVISLEYIGKIIMKNPITKFSTAAILIVALLISMHYIGNPFGATLTFADVIKPLINAGIVEFDIIIGDEETGIKIHDIVKGSRIRRTMENLGQTIIIDFDSLKLLTLGHKNKTAVVIDMKNLQDVPENYFNRLRNLVSVLESDPNFTIEDLGNMEIEGHKAVGFLATGPNVEVTIWADTQTAQPIRIEQRGQQLNEICKNFNFDIQMDDSFFSLDIPEGYSPVELQMDFTPGTEEEFIEGLRIRAEYIYDGFFPEDISVEFYIKSADKFGNKLNRLEISDSEKMAIAMSLQRHLMFIRFFDGQGKWYYSGMGVRLGDSQKPIFWYQPKDSENWRIIYGDLSVQEVSEENLPEEELSEWQKKFIEASKQWENITFTGTEIDTWRITALDEIVAHSDIILTKISDETNLMYIKLLYPQAKLEMVTFNNAEIPFEKIIEGRYEIELPAESISEDTARIEFVWNMPLETLKQADNSYRTILQGLLPVESFEVKTVLEPNCGYQHSRDKSQTQVMYFKTNSMFPISDSASCGLLIEKTE